MSSSDADTSANSDALLESAASLAKDSGRRRSLQVAGALFAVLIFQVIFGTSYIGAFHNPKASGIPLGIAAPTPVLVGQASALIEKQAGSQLALRPVASADAARLLIARRTIDGAYIVGTSGDTLLVASAASVNEAQALTTLFQAAAKSQKRALTVTDIAPLPAADPRGLAPFYLVLTWVVGGYLGATLVGLVRGPAAASRRFAIERVGALLGYAIASGVVVTLVERAAFGIGAGHLPQLCLVGALIVFSAAAAASGLQALLGLAGTAVVLVLFVALGNPSAGGAASYHLIPAFFRGLGPNLVNGAGVDLTRNVMYFSGNAIARPLLVLILWAVVGVILTIARGRGQRLATTHMQVGAAGVAGV